MRSGADVRAQNHHGDTVLHSLVAETVIEPHKTELMTNVYDTIVEESVVWWCKTKHMEVPDQSSSAHRHLKRFVQRPLMLALFELSKACRWKHLSGMQEVGYR